MKDKCWVEAWWNIYAEKIPSVLDAGFDPINGLWAWLDKAWPRAGLSVAAVALPIAIAYAELTGVSAAVGLYSCILPMIAYAFFGSSRQLIVGPDAATCAVIAAVVAPLAARE